MSLEIEKLGSEDQEYFGRIMARGFIDKFTKLSYEYDSIDDRVEVDTTLDETEDASPYKKKCPNADCSEYNKVIDTKTGNCDKCGSALVKVD